LSIIVFSVLVFAVSCAAGFLGAMTGLGGGVVLVPALVLLFHVNIHYAMGASLIAVMATSSGAAAVFLNEGYTNLRIGMLLETAAVAGAIGGAVLTAHLSPQVITLIFGVVLLVSAGLSYRRRTGPRNRPPHPWSANWKLAGRYSDAGAERHYDVYRVPTGLSLMALAGALSGLLGIGSGAVKVLAMDQAMGLPYKVSTATSNFIIGITAAASAGVYFAHGYINPAVTMPVMLGVLAGAMGGARLLIGARTGALRVIFSLVILALGIEMLYSGATGAF
jgi:uncharacterized membrane protein YfcA